MTTNKTSAVLIDFAANSTDASLLLDYLAIHHANLDPSQNSLDMIQETFRQFVVFLADKQDVTRWMPALRSYSYTLMDRLNRPQWHADWSLRSSDFAHYAQATLKGNR